MKNLILSAIFVLAAFVLFPAETSFAQTGGSQQKSQPPKVFKLSKQKQAQIKRKTNRRKSGYRNFIPSVKRSQGKISGRKVDLSKVPRVVTPKVMN